MFLLIGGPIFRREWIVWDWFAAIENQNFPLTDIGFIFEAAVEDEATVEALFSWYERHPQVRCFDVQLNSSEQHETHPEGYRTWRHDRYHTMARLRNNVLSRVFCYEPDRFFSLDSDVLLQNPNTLGELIEFTEEQVDACSPLLFMTPHPRDVPSLPGVAIPEGEALDFPGVMSWGDGPGGIAYRDRYSFGQFFYADIIMAAKMMNKRSYSSVRYQWHRQGEDLGWSANCYKAGLRLGCASHLYASHIMSRKALENYRLYGDPRYLILGGSKQRHPGQ